MTRDADGHDAFTDALSTGPDIYDYDYTPPAHIDASRLAEARDGWLGVQPLPDPQQQREADYEGDDPDIEALRHEKWTKERWAA